MAASPAIKLGEPLEALFRNAGVPDDFYRRYKERLLDMDVGDAGDLLEEVALKGIASLRIQQRQAEKLHRYLLGRRGWEDAAAVLASFGRLSLDDTSPGVAAGDQVAGGAASAPPLFLFATALRRPLGGGGGPRGHPCGGEMGSHGPPQLPIFSSVYVALTNIPVGELLKGLR